MPKVRVLVVDDSVTIRRLLTDALSKDSEIEVVGSAANGRIALSKLQTTPPDLVIMDVEMPELDGISTLRELRKTHAKLPVIMFSTLTERGALTTLEALGAGASDYLTKPQAGAGLPDAMARLRETLIPKVRALGGLRSTPPAAVKAAPMRVIATPLVRPDVLAIGASTGGPNALAEVLANLPPLPIPTVITQHMPPLFTRLFAERLQATTRHTVREAAEGDVLLPGHVYIAPGDRHMLVTRAQDKTIVHLDDGPPESSCRPAVDPMLRSVVQVYGPRVLSVILTGMGQDGLEGCRVVREAGGQVVAQDEATSVVWGMPGFVAREGLAHAVVALKDVAAEIVRRTARAGTGERTTRETEHVDP